MPSQVMQRSHGSASVTLGLRAGKVHLRDLAQSGSAKAVLPGGGPGTEIVFLNTSGGLTGGDALDFAVSLDAGVKATATTQTAERAYKAGDRRARLTVRADVGAGGWLDWLPQETILFDGAALDRTTDIHLGPGAGCILCETLIFGRIAMGETLRTLSLTDRRRIFRGGVLVATDPLALNSAALGAGPAVLGDALAVASLIGVGPGMADMVAPVRRVLTTPRVNAGASGWDDRLSLRLMARHPQDLRRQLTRVLDVLRRPRPLPRVWQDLGEIA